MAAQKAQDTSELSLGVILRRVFRQNIVRRFLSTKIYQTRPSSVIKHQLIIYRLDDLIISANVRLLIFSGICKAIGIYQLIIYG